MTWKSGIVAIVAAGITLVAVGVASGLIPTRTNRDRGGNSVAMGDGEWMRLFSVTAGQTHDWVLGRFPKLDPVRRAVPPLQAILGEMTETVTTGYQEEGLCIFYGGEDDAGVSKSPKAWFVAAYDEHGCRLPIESSRGEQTLRGGRSIAYQILTTYPRREAKFEVLVGESGSQSDEGVRMTIVNPRPWKGPDWVAEAVPAVRETDGLKITYLGYSGQDRWPVPKFRVEEGGRDAPEWVAGKIEYRDATGNHHQAPHLCRFESAWRIEASFERNEQFSFGSDESWTVWEGDLPPAGEGKSLQGSHALQGVRVELNAIGGPGVFDFEKVGGHWEMVRGRPLQDGESSDGTRSGKDQGREWFELKKSRPWLMLSLTGLTPEHTWHLGFRGASGRYERTRGWSGVGMTYTTFFNVPKATVISEIRLVIQRWRTVAFTVAPPKIPSP